MTARPDLAAAVLARSRLRVRPVRSRRRWALGPPVSWVIAVVVRIVGPGGRLLPVPGAPAHAAPDGGDDSDPADDAPAEVAVPAG